MISSVVNLLLSRNCFFIKDKVIKDTVSTSLIKSVLGLSPGCSKVLRSNELGFILAVNVINKAYSYSALINEFKHQELELQES